MLYSNHFCGLGQSILPFFGEPLVVKARKTADFAEKSHFFSRHGLRTRFVQQGHLRMPL